MPISATGKAETAGFTLVELMVVLAIIGISAAVVVLMLPGADAAARTDAERLASRLLAARDHALFSGRQTAAVVDARGYRFEENAGGEWTTLMEAPLKAGIWDQRVTVSSTAPFPLRIRFDSVGTADTAALNLASGGETVTVSVPASGEARLQ